MSAYNIELNGRDRLRSELWWEGEKGNGGEYECYFRHANFEKHIRQPSGDVEQAIGK